MTDQPTRHDLTTADMDLFAHDARKPRHSIETCETTDCWACTWERSQDRLWRDSRDEREYDRREAS